METDSLLEFLYNHTNYDSVIDNSYRYEDITRLEFKLDLLYLWKNTCNWAVRNVIKYPCVKVYWGYDEEAASLVMEERLIHPIILAREIECEVGRLLIDLRELNSEYFVKQWFLKDFNCFWELRI